MYEGSHANPEAYDTLARRIERLYRRLSGLRVAPAIEPALAEVLRLLADVARCTLVYVEVHGADDAPVYWLGHTPHALPPGAIRSRVSRDLIQRSVAERRTLDMKVPKAPTGWAEEQFALCTPLGDVVPVGVVYVHSAERFLEDDRERLEFVAIRLAEVHDVLKRAPRTLAVRIRDLQEQCVREEMKRHGGNKAAVARELGVGRAFVYDVLERGRVSG